MCSILAKWFLGVKCDVALDEAERLGSSFLDLRSLELSAFPARLSSHNDTFRGKLRRLYLQRNHLTCLPSTFGMLLPALRVLSIDHNCIEELPKSFVILDNLRKLNISHNNFSQAGFPSVIVQLPNLLILWANSSQIQEIPRDVNSLKKLQVLGLRNNELSQIPAEVFQISSLLRLSLAKNSLSLLPSDVSLLTTLVRLNLDDNELYEVPNQLCQLPELRYLCLRYNFLRVTSAVIESLEKFPQLKWADLQGNPRNASMNEQYKGKHRTCRRGAFTSQAHVRKEGRGPVVLSMPLAPSPSQVEGRRQREEMLQNEGYYRMREWINHSRLHIPPPYDVNGNGEVEEGQSDSSTASTPSIDHEEEDRWSHPSDTLGELSPWNSRTELISVVEESFVARPFLDLDGSEFQTSDRSSDIDLGNEEDEEEDRVSAISSDSQLNAWVVDGRDANNILRTII